MMTVIPDSTAARIALITLSSLRASSADVAVVMVSLEMARGAGRHAFIEDENTWL